MADILIKVKRESCFGMPHELKPKIIDIERTADNIYFAKLTKYNSNNLKETYKNELKKSDVDSILKELQSITIPAFPNHFMGDDGGFTEIIVGGYAGKSSFRWWSGTPKGWECLDEITNKIVKLSGFTFY